ncbi:uncharacterized protein LOC120110627 [Phoenix dactylifera]|uniref:Uncharacterized protein LOC120110627 n=1 Tax=Phoenix dactylifera TaxID=42345 RepID=A0A8B9A657_PHODC|nr:uncharacterized protein LOC120110627 [Phoenix dactylifera]
MLVLLSKEGVQQNSRKWLIIGGSLWSAHWWNFVERITDEEKVRFAIYMLQDRAHHWWKSVEHTLAHRHEPVTWQGFRTTFYSKYFPFSRLRELEREFLNISQGTITVDEYEAKFDKLFRFAPTLIMDAESKIRRFEEGLKSHLHRGLAAMHSASYDVLVDMAKNMEIVWKETQDVKNGKQKKRSRDFNTRSGQNSSKTAKSHNRSWQSEKHESYGRTTQHQQDRSKCEACGGAHKIELYRRLSNACFRCGQQGHKIKKCPCNQQVSQSVQRPQATRT